MSEVLDEKGFVFIDGHSRPYWCRIYCGEPWFLYWHPDKKWVTLRKVNQTEIHYAKQMAITQEQAEIYHNLHNKPYNQ